MSEFFADDKDDSIYLSDVQRNPLKEFSHLNKEQQTALVDFFKTCNIARIIPPS